MTRDTQNFDAIVVGAGPAGSSAAAVLADHGRRVALLERDPFPRYHIGESLIPHCWHALDRIGLVEKLDASSFIVHKHSVQFVGVDGVRSKPFYFFEHDEHPSSRTWQVVRSEFDRMMRDNAVEKGATLFEGTTAKDLVRDGSVVRGVIIEGPDGETSELSAPITVDASGRDLFAASRNGWRVSDKDLAKVAIWGYYEGAQRDPGLDAGATTIANVPEQGWFWYLPLANDVVSVGVVAEPDYLFGGDARDPGEILEREVARQPWIQEHVASGRRRDDVKVTRDFSYRSRYCAEDGLVLAGDAFAFLDPVFSSGVYFALHGGIWAGDAVHAALEAGDTSAAAFEEYGERCIHGIEAMRRLVHVFYDPNFRFGDFFKKYPDMRSGVTDVLIGKLDRDFDPLFHAMAEFAAIPAPLLHGRPLEA